MRLRALTWASDKALLVQAGAELNIDLRVWSVQELSDPGAMEECRSSLNEADLILVHPTHDGMFDDLLNINKPIISFGFDPSLWTYSRCVSPKVVATVNTYVVYGGLENIKNMLLYIGREVLGLDLSCREPQETLWQGIYHPDAERAFETVEEYLEWRPFRHKHTIGILFFRTYWANRDLEIVDGLIRALEREFNVIAAFGLGSVGSRQTNAKQIDQVVREFFSGRVELIINLQSVFHAGSVEVSINSLKELDIPVIHPLTLYHKTEDEWKTDFRGMDPSEIGWSIALPEFEGLIENIAVGVAERKDMWGDEVETHRPIGERVERLVNRIRAWIRLRSKPRAERRIAFVLHNSPCASVEATVGAAAHLDTLESVARIMSRLSELGYQLDTFPGNGKELIEDILNHKAISEFRWTTVSEIVSKGGALALVDPYDYERWFNGLPEESRSRICQAWGRPPGEPRDGLPAPMLHEGKIVVTGRRYGNVVVCVQPKRGCAGARCDGQACRILHDPETPPTHQYLATYKYLERDFGADVIIHVGTHGNLEFLPGKSVALSENCFPDIAIGDLPHLYIYNSDNPAEGTVAKRRSYAVTVDHMQTVMTTAGLYGELKELDDRIDEYRRAEDHGRRHALKHIILELLERSNLAEELKVDLDKDNFEYILERAHAKLSEIYSSYIPDGMHIFGEVPQGDKRVEMVSAILKPLVRGSADLRDTVRAVLSGEDADPEIKELIDDIARRMDGSDEMGSLMHAIDGGFVRPGPSGLITRGKPEVLPTGRNMYSLDPGNIPTQAAALIGKQLAEKLLERYRKEHERWPENVAMYWMASDIMWADGEQLAQMFYLLGVEPTWKGGRLSGYRIIPLEDLGRPRIDLTVRVSGITRDCFMGCIELLDSAIQDVAALDEPPEMNYVRKHLIESGDARALRIFASPPGTYGSGVNLAVYASAWKDEKDLSDVFLQWNSYAYGKNLFGDPAPRSLKEMLRTVDAAFNKTVTDEYDLLGCCCYFGTYGGLTNAAETLSGHRISTYYGDTRDSEMVEIRTLADEIRWVVRTKLLNPKWIEGMKRHGYKGAGDISKRVGRVYGWEATTKEVDDWVFDDIAKTFVLDEEMRSFFEESNPWALEEIGRRLLEAHQRGLWDADPEVLDSLRSAYLEIEGWIEDKVGGGGFQGGSIDVMTMKDVAEWRDKAARILREAGAE
ncbi:MAG: cobaltochelatase subunit CobN [Methanothrix sp.]|uniref:cobaltochelatase subunit CobN n=1 Tax=Methanothrix sp. TaxID=90426 RepID=UPI0025D21661|nr:cobaltochelatase subunit CobN [Methanothrix sp.]MCQ8903530.1 cobaltochelatase subunit CobN [Methanothrix sp.]